MVLPRRRQALLAACLLALWGQHALVGVDATPRVTNADLPIQDPRSRLMQGYDGSRCLNDCYQTGEQPHGYCSDGPVPLCQCHPQWQGPAADCSERTCPLGRSWFDEPSDAYTAHTSIVPCSNKGSCNYAEGTCTCDRGFEGEACQRMLCPGTVQAGPCNGHGRCMTLGDAGRQRDRITFETPLSYAGWEADMVQVCVCDPGWSGGDCSKRECPEGSDPLSQGTLEVQALRTSLTSPVKEVQRVSFTLSATGGTGSAGGADVDEVQVLWINGTTEAPAGTITLTFDSTVIGPAGQNSLCAVSSRSVTGPINVTSNSAATTATAVQTALNGLANIGAGGVVVTANPVQPTFGIAMAITFVGAGVGGNLMPLIPAGGGLSVGSGTLAIGMSTTVDGSMATGTFQLTYDDTTTVPSRADMRAGGDYDDDTALAPQGARTSISLNATASAAQVSAAVWALVSAGLEPSVTNGIVVTRNLAGGPAPASWDVTFTGPGARIRGNLAQMGVASVALAIAHPAISGGTASVATSSVSDGSFLGGTWKPALSYTAEDGSTSTTASVATPFAWNAPPATVAAGLQALDTGLGIGTLGVTRVRGIPSRSDGVWSGEYEWRVSFRSLAEDVPLAPTPTSTGLTPVAAGATASAVTLQDGDPGSAEVNEVMLIDCKCAACNNPSSHFVRLTFRGERTAPIPYSASAADVRAALAALSSVPDVRVNLYDRVSGTASSMCDADGTTTAITFTHNPGNQAGMYIDKPATDYKLPATAGQDFGIRVAPAYGAYGGRAIKGTRKLLPCSGRGSCGDDGTCTCVGSVPGVPDYGDSDNGGGDVAAGPGNSTSNDGFANCGYVINTNLTALAPNSTAQKDSGASCPTTVKGKQCSNNGWCSGAPEFKCSCNTGYTGPACEQRTCPMHRAWSDIPSSETYAHAPAVCSGRGDCETLTGTCFCYGGFTGKACELMECPAGGTFHVADNAANDTCANGQRCVTMRELGLRYSYGPDDIVIDGPDYKTPWDADMIRGCVCSRQGLHAGYEAWGKTRYAGYDCKELLCPRGSDPMERTLTEGTNFEVQSITCYATNGSFTLQYRNATTRRIRYNSYVRNYDAPFEELSSDRYTIENAINWIHNATGHIAVSVQTPGAFQACSASGVETRVTFLSIAGDAPMLKVIPDATMLSGGNPTPVVIAEVVKGSRPALECGRRGVCDRTTGRCKCGPQFGSSDGAFGDGENGDCGNLDAEYSYRRDVATVPFLRVDMASNASVFNLPI